MDKLKRLIALVSIFIVLITINNNEAKYTHNYELIEEGSAFARYDDGLIYIVKEKEAKEIELNEGDILVIDARDKKDPNMKVRSSYEIKDKDKRNTIIEVLQEYERQNPSNWNRSTETMRLEWFVHNLSYNYNYEVDRAKDVDLNNKDEEVYKSKVLRKILGL